MADRTIVTRMRVEYKQAVDGMNAVGTAAGKASEKIEEAGRASQQSTQKTQGAFSKMAQHASANEEAWNSVGTALSVAGGAIVGFGLAAGKAGIEFNSLKQTSGAALKTVTGSAEDARRQMDKLNEFGSKSWVMRDVLIRSQQAMAGFGVETKKIIPYLDGLQEAVAASGGSSQDFEELARVMAKVKSQGKITAETFNEFGTRGVDAATIIGEQMGMTGQEIRDSVTDGALGADQALDALAKGMKTKFDGATENLRNTFRGAMDNLTAAWRDLSASMAEPIVGPDGGGLAVSGLNALADAIVRVKDVADEMPNGVKATGLVIGGLAGATSLAAGGFLLLAPRIVETQKAFSTLAGQDDLVGKTARGMQALKGPMLAIAKAGATAAVLGGITVAIAEMVEGNKLEQAQQGSKSVANALEDLKKSADGLDRVFQLRDGGALTGDINSLGDALDRTFNRDWEERFNDWGESIIQKFTRLRGESGMIADGFSSIDTELANLVDSGKADEAAAAFEKIRLQAEEQDVSLERLKILFPEYADAVEAAGSAAAVAAEGIGEMSPKAVEANQHLQEVKDQLTESAEGFLNFSEKATDAKVSLQAWIDDMEAQVEAQQTWFDNLGELMQRGAPQEFIDFLMSLGPEGAKRVKQLADASDTELQRAINKFSEGKDAASDFAEEVLGIPPVDLDADASKLKKQVKTAEDRLAELRKLPTTPEIDAQITALEEQVKAGRAKLNELEKKKTTAKVDADTSKAKEDVNGFKAWFKDNSTVTMTVIQKIKEVFDPKVPSQGGKKDKKGNNSRSPMGRATGGRVIGPGSGTSDDIPAWLSNGEHVWTAEEVRKAGGHGVIEAMRAAAKSGNAFASGGAVGSAERRLADAQRRLDAISSRGQKRSAEDVRRDRAQARVDAARDALDRAKEAEARRERVSSLQSDLRVDVRRGSIRDQVTGGLSGGYSAVDRLFGLGGNEDLSRGSRSRANSSARKFEANLKTLYAQAERIDERLKKAQDKATELKGIKDSVTSSLLGGRGVDVGDYQNFEDGQWSTYSGVAGATRRMTADVGAMKAFAGKLKKLAGKGIPGAIIQEIAQAGVAEGSTMADAFLDASDAEVKSYVGAWKDYERYAGQAGQYVTEGFYSGGSAAADGVVKGLEGRKKNVESAIANLAKAMESTFKQVLGIHSPSRVMSELGGFTAEGLVQGMLGGVTDVQSAAAALGSAAVPNMMAFAPSDMSMDVGVSPVVSDDEGMAGLAMQDMSNTTLEAMAAMGLAVSDGFAGMLANTQAAQAQMLLDTQLNQSGMLTATQEANLGQLTDTQTQQAAMLLNTQTQNANMLLDTQTQQEAMRSTVQSKQTGQRTATETQQELMRLMLIDKQSQMKTKSAEDFESLKETTRLKFSAMRTNTDTAMSNIYSDYDTRLADLKGLNKRGFESILSTSVKNMEGVRDGIDGQMAAAKPEMGNRLNSLIGVLSKFTASVNKAFGDVGVELKAPQALKFATGGVMPGYSPGADIHRFVSPTAGELHLSGGEAIMRPEWTRAMGGEAAVKAQNEAAKQGRFDDLFHMQESGHFATGGVYGRVPGVNAFADSGVWRNLWAITKAKFPNATLNSAYRGGSITASGNTSHHARGNAIDVNPSMDIFNFWRNKYGANLAELIYSPAGNKQIKNGSNYTYTGAVKSMHYNHVHIAALRALSDAMAGGLPGMGGEMSHPFLDRAKVNPGDDLAKSYKQAAEKLTAQIYGKFSGQLPQGEFGQLGKGIMSQVSEGLVKKATEFGKNAGTADFSNVAAGPTKTMARDMLKQMGWEDQFGDLDWLLTRESGWNPRAQNPTSTAYGLFQFLNGTWGTVGATKTSDPKKQLEAGLKYIQQRYGDVRGARSFWERNHWYEDGTNSAKKGWAVVGENGPELVKLNGGETVKNGAQTRKLLAENRTFIPNAGSSGGLDYDALAKAVVSNLPPSLVVNNDNAGLIEERIAKKTVQEFADKQALYTMGV